MKMRRNSLTFWLCLILAGIAIFSGYEIVKTLLEYKAGEDAYNHLQQYVSVAEPTDPAKDETQETMPGQTDGDQGPEVTVPVVVDENKLGIHVDFDALHKINSDVVGWIYLEDSKINFPVAQGDDNQEYLYQLINGDYNGSGTPFVDYRNAPDFSDRNTIIYGHNMNNGAMFADIHKYEDQAYYDSHPVIWVLTPTRNYRLEIFAGYKTGLDADAWQMFFVSDDEFMEWVDTAIEKSAFESDVIPTVDDRIVTLSTCSDSANQIRFVLLGVIRE